MKNHCIAFMLLTSLLTYSQTTNSNCRRCGSGVASFFGALTGTTFAAKAYSDRCYYREGPPYEFSYPGAPLYIYDYPTYMYAPRYAYWNVRYDVYPSYFLRRNP